MKTPVALFLFMIFSSVVGFSQTADFSYNTSDGLFCSPVTVSFTPTVTGSPIAYLWNFGNGTAGTSTNPSVLYSKPGSFTVTLTVVYNTTAVNVTKVVVINPAVTVTVAPDRNYICTPGPVKFTAGGSASVNSYQWDFGDGSPVVTTPGNTVSHNYAAFGSYNPTVKAIGTGGCSASASTAVSVMVPPVSGTTSPDSGCIPAVVTFTAAAVIPTGSFVSNYQWNFDDGSPLFNSPSNNVNHTYAAVGAHFPTVKITTNEGCTNTFNYSRLAYGTPPTGHVAYVFKDTVCGSDMFTIVSKAVTANSYKYDFNDGVTKTVADTITTYKYRTIGKHIISVTPSFNGCAGTTINIPVFVKGVIAGFTLSNTCGDKSTFAFNSGTSQGNISSYTWDFGDGSPISNVPNPTHTFAKGSYNVTLTLNDSTTGCSDAIVTTVYIATPSLVNSEKIICRNDTTTFIILNNYKNPGLSLEWHVAGLIVQPTYSDTLSLKATLFGIFNNEVIISNGPGYCLDTIREVNTIKVGGPELNFTPSRTSLCVDAGTVSFNNTSKPYFPADLVNLWYWDFGAGAGNDTVYQPKPYLFPYPSTFGVKLFARDINGCVDSLVKNVQVNPLPFVKTIPSIDTLCQGQKNTLIVYHSDTLTWSNGPYTCLSANCDTISVSPPNTTLYYANAKSAYGCVNKDSVLVKVYKPFTAVTNFSDTAVCKGQTIQFKVLPADKRILWQPNTNISSTTVANPLIMVNSSQNYSVALVDSAGCFSDTAYVNVISKSLPIISAGPDRTFPYNSFFTMQPKYSSPIKSYDWSPATNLTCSTCAVPNGTSLATTTYTLTVVSDSGCVASDKVTIYVECRNTYLYMPTAFSPRSQNGNNMYYPLTRGIKIIKRLTVYNRYGQKVYEGSNFPPNAKSYGWDGKLKGIAQPTGGYVYYMDAICDVGQEISTKGSFVLIE